MAMIDTYDFGKIVIDGKEYRSDVIIYPDRVDGNWWRREGHKLCLDDLRDVLEARPEILIVGTGYSGLVQVLPEVETRLSQMGIELRASRTARACEQFNRLASLRRVVAALHLTC